MPNVTSSATDLSEVDSSETKSHAERTPEPSYLEELEEEWVFDERPLPEEFDVLSIAAAPCPIVKNETADAHTCTSKAISNADASNAETSSKEDLGGYLNGNRFRRELDDSAEAVNVDGALITDTTAGLGVKNDHLSQGSDLKNDPLLDSPLTSELEASTTETSIVSDTRPNSVNSVNQTNTKIVVKKDRKKWAIALVIR